MKKYISPSPSRFRVFVLLCFCAFTLSAQQSYLDRIKIANMDISKRAGTASIAMDLNLDGLRIGRNDMLVITPIVHSTDGQKSVELAPIYVLGTTRNRVLARPFTWEGKPQISHNAFVNIVRQNGTKQTIRYVATLPFEEWNRDAGLWLKAEIIGCADCVAALDQMNINNRIFPPRFVPDFRTTYTMPDQEIPKRRSESYSARLNFPVNRHDILPNFDNNASELANVHRSITELRSDDNLEITNFTISGFASPEGTAQSNMLLSQRRAESFAQYIEKQYNFTRNQFAVEWFGEDWNGLRKAVEASSLPNKAAILNIIDTEPDFDARDAKLVALDNGQTYSRLLREFYPPLRRNDYNIAFIARPFETYEASQVIKTNPYHLNLREMWDVAQAFSEDSNEHKQVFDIAADTFPDWDIANLNAAVAELRRNNANAAIERLRKVTNANDAKALNLWGIAYTMRGDTERATECFNRAIQGGNTDAQHNLEQLKQYVKDNE